MFSTTRSKAETSARRKFYLTALLAATTISVAMSLLTSPVSESNMEVWIFFLNLTLVALALPLWLIPGSVRAVEYIFAVIIVGFDFVALGTVLYLDSGPGSRDFIEPFSLWAPLRFVWLFLAFGQRNGLRVSAAYLAGIVSIGLPYLLGAVPPREANEAVRSFIVNFPMVSGVYLVLLYAFAYFLETSVQARAKAEVAAELAYTDPLTGLPNRLLFEDRLTQAATQAKRERRCFALIFIDLDRFKLVNDTLGHRAGDLLLKGIGARMSARLRDTDTLARISGDEFAVILRDTQTLAAASFTAEKLLGAFDEPFDLDGTLRHAGASLGVALYPEHGMTPDELLVHADQAMYVAKERGRCRYHVYQTENDIQPGDQRSLDVPASAA